MKIIDDILAVTIITFMVVGVLLQDSSWENKIKTQGVIEVDGKHYKIKEVVLFKTYKEK